MSPSAVSTSSTLYGSPSASNRFARLVARDLLAVQHPPLRDLALDLRLDPLEIGLARSAPGTRSRSRSRARSAARSRPSRRDRAAAPPRRAGARSSGAGRRARRDRELSRVVRNWIGWPSASGSRRSWTQPFDAHEHSLLGELRPDRARGVEAGRAVGELELLAVGEDHLHAQDTDGLRGPSPADLEARFAAGLSDLGRPRVDAAVVDCRLRRSSATVAPPSEAAKVALKHFRPPGSRSW